MSEAQAAPMGEATTAQEATEAVGKQFAGKEAAPKESGPDLGNMTGAEAKAYVESLKAKEKIKGKNPVKEAAKSASEKVVAKPNVLTADSVKEAIETARKMKFKDKENKEFEVDEEEVKSTYLQRKEHQQAANKILQEGKAARRQAEEFISMMKDPAKFYETAQKLGHDPRKLAEEYLARKLEDEMMDPRDRELKETKEKLRQIYEFDRQEKERLESHRHEVLKRKFAADYTTQFTEALKESQLPPTKAMVAEMAKYIHRSAKIGFQMTAKEAAQLVKEDLSLSIQRLTGEADGDTLMRLLGDQAANKIRAHDVAKLKNPEQHLRTPEQQGEGRTRKSAPTKRMTPTEWRNFNRP